MIDLIDRFVGCLIDWIVGLKFRLGLSIDRLIHVLLVWCFKLANRLIILNYDWLAGWLTDPQVDLPFFFLVFSSLICVV